MSKSVQRNKHAQALGKLGGQSQSPAKRSASAQNGRKLKERAEEAERRLDRIRTFCAVYGHGGRFSLRVLDLTNGLSISDLTSPAAGGGAR